MANPKAWNREMPQTEVDRLKASCEALNLLLDERDAQIDQLQNVPWGQWMIAVAVTSSMIASGLTAWFI